ncbi:hypothetical protein ABVT39_018208 [Epinephelus coioides]
MRPNYRLNIFQVSILAALFLRLEADSENPDCEVDVKVRRHTVYESLPGEDLRINCTVMFCKNSPPTVTWYKREIVDVPVNFSRSSHMTTEWELLNHSEGISFLIFHKTLVHDTGVYQCRSGGGVGHNIKVFVRGENPDCEVDVKVRRHTVYESLPGEDLRINCTVMFCKNSPPTVTWYKREIVDVPVNFSRSSHMTTEWELLNHSEGISFLIFHKTLVHDTGVYQCRSGGGVGHNIKVFVRGENPDCEVDVKVRRHTVYESLPGEDLRINCTVMFCKNSPPTVTWYKREIVDVPVNFSRSSHMTTEWELLNHSEGISFLIFHKTLVHDTGVYQCRSGGGVGHNIKVFVRGENPDCEVDVKVRRHTVYESLPGEDLRINCTVMFCKNSPPTVTWYKREIVDVPVNFSRSSHMTTEWELLNHSEGISFLIFHKTLVHDTGVYQCRSGGGVGHNIKVFVRGEDSDEVDLKVARDTVYETVTGEDLRINCTVAFCNDSPPTVFWYKREKTDVPVDVSSRIKTEWKRVNHSEGILFLIFQNIFRSDSGVYQCHSGGIVCHNVNVSVHDVKLTTGTWTTLEPGEDSGCEVDLKVARDTVYETVTGEDLRINCIVAFCNDSPPTITWYKREKTDIPVDVSSHIKTEWKRVNHSEGISFLIFQKIFRSDSGVYQCRSGDIVSHNVNVSVHGE